MVKRKIENAKMEYLVKIPDLQVAIDNQIEGSKPKLDGYDYNVYHTVEEVRIKLNDLSVKFKNPKALCRTGH